MPLRFSCGVVVYLRESYDAAGVNMQDALLAHLSLADSPCRSEQLDADTMRQLDADAV